LSPLYSTDGWTGELLRALAQRFHALELVRRSGIPRPSAQAAAPPNAEAQALPRG
jgi:hypothetical protein